MIKSSVTAAIPAAHRPMSHQCRDEIIKGAELVTVTLLLSSHEGLEDLPGRWCFQRSDWSVGGGFVNQSNNNFN